MATTNDITGDSIRSKANNKAFADGWDRIFGNKKTEAEKYIDNPENDDSELWENGTLGQDIDSAVVSQLQMNLIDIDLKILESIITGTDNARDLHSVCLNLGARQYVKDLTQYKTDYTNGRLSKNEHLYNRFVETK